MVSISVSDARGPKAVALVAADILGSAPWTTYLDERGYVSFAIPASSAGRTYRVTASSCECADHVYRASVCKHQWAARLRLAYDLEREPAF
jgi:hypothetical protein